MSGMGVSYDGRLLVASPVLRDPNFERAVILILDHDHSGTLGVVLNRPLGTDVDEVLPDWTPLVSDPPTLFNGGPVSVDSALAVGVLPRVTESPPLGFRPMCRRFGLVDLDMPAQAIAGALGGLRVFAGYAGWGAGQLDAEVAAGGWLILEPEEGDLTTDRPEPLWRTVLRRQTDDVRLMSTFPSDPTMN